MLPSKPPLTLACQALSTYIGKQHSEGGRPLYKTELALLWKGGGGGARLLNNRAMAVLRLHSTERKLKKNPELTI